VAAPPRVALLCTGDELVMPGSVAPQDLPPGHIYDSNRFFLRALLARLGCQVNDLGVVADRLDATVAALEQAAQTHDLILTSGGVSVGEEDHVKPAVQQLGRLDLWQIAIKPGKPFAFGELRRAAGGVCYFAGLPGNPVSGFITFVLLVRPLLLRLQGAGQADDSALPLRADFDWPKPGQRREFLRVRRNAGGGLELHPNQGSAAMTALHWADGLVDLPAGQTVARGDTVRYWPLAEAWS
jgi:molybdopterin molybdotransferase